MSAYYDFVRSPRLIIHFACNDEVAVLVGVEKPARKVRTDPDIAYPFAPIYWLMELIKGLIAAEVSVTSKSSDMSTLR